MSKRKGWHDPIHAKFLEIKRDPKRFDPVRFKYRNPSNREARELARRAVRGQLEP